jgi:hypothetical protein
MSTIIIAAILVISAIGIFAIFVSIGKKNIRKRNKTLLKRLNKSGSEHELSFSSPEILKNKIIGLDRLNQTLLIFEFENANNVICINMREVKNCTVEKKYDSIVIGNERKAKLEPHLRSIGIKFSFKNSCEPISVSIYDSSINSIYEMQELEVKAKNWEKTLSRMISKELEVRA